MADPQAPRGDLAEIAYITAMVAEHLEQKRLDLVHVEKGSFGTAYFHFRAADREHDARVGVNARGIAA